LVIIIFADIQPKTDMEKKNSTTLSKENNQRNKEKCKKIQSISPRIRYVGMINDFGRTIAGHIRSGVVPLFNREQAVNDHFIEAMRTNLRKALYSAVGNVNYSYTEHEKVKMLTVPTHWGHYSITLDKETENTEIKQIIDEVLKVVATLQ
jgi:flagellar biosynthesis/type III secretory pathway chaperone